MGTVESDIEFQKQNTREYGIEASVLSVKAISKQSVSLYHRFAHDR